MATLSSTASCEFRKVKHVWFTRLTYVMAYFSVQVYIILFVGGLAGIALTTVVFIAYVYCASAWLFPQHYADKKVILKALQTRDIVCYYDNHWIMGFDDCVIVLKDGYYGMVNERFFHAFPWWSMERSLDNKIIKLLQQHANEVSNAINRRAGKEN